MAATVKHRHGLKCQLIAALGLDHDTPLIEWHEWVPVDVDDLPIASTGVDGWKYLQVPLADTTNRADPEYPDYTWPTGTTRFGNYVDATPWALNTAIWLRRTIETYPGEAVRITGRADNSVEIFWNGRSLGTWSGVSNVDFSVDVPADKVFTANVLAVHAMDDAGTNPTDHCEISVGVAKVPAVPRVLLSNAWVPNDARTAALIDYQATHGRPTPTQAPEPLNTGVRLARYFLDEIPATGDRFRLTLNADVAAALGVDDAERPRFTGEVTDVNVDAAGDFTVVSVTALGRQVRLNRLPVTMARAQETDGERAYRILSQVAITLPIEIGTVDPGTVTLLESDPEAVPAQQLLDQVAADSLGRVVEHRSGRLDYQDAGHRRGRTSLVTLAGDQHLIQPFSWQQNVASVVNDATATFGPESDREVVRVTDPVSANPDTGVGAYPVSLDTLLAAADDAYALLTNLVGRYSRPAWWLPSLLVDLHRTAGDQAAALLEVSHGDKITAAGLPPDGAFTDGDVFVEGSTEIHSARGWQLSLVVADPALAGAGLRWVDLPRFLRWQEVDPTVTWLDLATVVDPYTLGRPVCDGGTSAARGEARIAVDGGNGAGRDWRYDYVLEGTP